MERHVTRNSLWMTFWLLAASLAFQAGADDGRGQDARSQVEPPRSALTEGEVRKVDRAKGEITIKHGPMPKFDMPGMTMVYRVKNKALLDRLQPGDKIKFDADGINGAFTVTRLVKVK